MCLGKVICPDTQRYSLLYINLSVYFVKKTKTKHKTFSVSDFNIRTLGKIVGCECRQGKVNILKVFSLSLKKIKVTKSVFDWHSCSV